MKKLLYIVCLALPVAFGACALDDVSSQSFDKQMITLSVQCEFQEEYLASGFPKSGHDVEFRNQLNGVSYIAKTDNNGFASQQVEYGTYVAYVRGQIPSGSSKVILTGSESFDGVTKEDAEVTIQTNFGFTSPLIMREVYVAGSTLNDGSTYTQAKKFDAYVAIYNNSADVQYADGLCFAIHTAMASTASAIVNWFKKVGTPRDSIPISLWAYVIPGNIANPTKTIQPGEEIIFALNAVDHTTLVSGAKVSNLDRANVYPLYSANTTALWAPGNLAKPNAVYEYEKGAGAQMTFGFSPAFIMYRMQPWPGAVSTTFQDLAEEYIKDGAISGAKTGPRMYPPPGYTTGTQAIMVPWQWVIDGLDIRANATNNPRLPGMIDSGHVLNAANNSGISHVRKVDQEATAEAGGRIVYQDTNYANNDWEYSDPPTMVGK